MLLAHQQRQRAGALEDAASDEEDGDRAELVEKIVRDRKRAARASRAAEVPESKERELAPAGVLKRIFGIGPACASVPASRLVHPGSPFHEVCIPRKRRSRTGRGAQ